MMLKVRGIEGDGKGTRHFRIDEEGRPASEASLKLVAFYTKRLLAENELAGGCRALADGLLALDVPETGANYFYDGLVFAALDAFNHPNKNPTISSLRPPEE